MIAKKKYQKIHKDFSSGFIALLVNESPKMTIIAFLISFDDAFYELPQRKQKK